MQVEAFFVAGQLQLAAIYAILIFVRVLINYMLRKDTWFVHAITKDALTPISPILSVHDQATLIRLLRYVGAGDSDIEEVNVNIGRWARGCTWVELTPGRKNLLRIRRPWSDQLGVPKSPAGSPR